MEHKTQPITHHKQNNIEELDLNEAKKGFTSFRAANWDGRAEATIFTTRTGLQTMVKRSGQKIEPKRRKLFYPPAFELYFYVFLNTSAQVYFYIFFFTKAPLSTVNKKRFI